MKAINLQKDNVLSLMAYLEDLDWEASTLNKSTSDLLLKAKLSGKISKDIYAVLNNTLQSAKRGELTINGQVVKPYEKTEVASTSITFAVPLEDATYITSAKMLGGWLDNLEDWNIEHFNDNGTEFKSSSNNGDGFSFDVKRGVIKSGDYSWKLKDDFTHILNVPEQGIYLFKKVNDVLEGVTWLRWKV